MPTAERTTEPAGPSATSDEELAFPPAIRERHLLRPHLVFSADYTLMSGLLLQGDVGVFDNDGTDPDYPGGDKEWQAVIALDLAF